MEITFEVLGKPVGKQRPRVCTHGDYTHAYTPQNTLDYEQKVQLEYTRKMRGKDSHLLWGKSLSVYILACYTPPRAFSRLKTNEALRGILRPQAKPDIDNIAKIVLDSLNKIAYSDDSFVVQLVAEKRYSEEAKVVIKIEEIGG